MTRFRITCQSAGPAGPSTNSPRKNVTSSCVSASRLHVREQGRQQRVAHGLARPLVLLQHPGHALRTELVAFGGGRLEHAVGDEQDPVAEPDPQLAARERGGEAGRQRQVHQRSAAGRRLTRLEPRPLVPVGAEHPAARMAGVAHREPSRGGIVGEDRGRGHGLRGPRRQPPVQSLQHAALVQRVHAAPEVRVHLRAHGGQRVAMAGDVGHAHASDQAGAAHRQVVDVAAARARAGVGVEHAVQPGELDNLARGVIAAADFVAGQARCTGGRGRVQCGPEPDTDGLEGVGDCGHLDSY